jgi:hypothetical protein
MVRTTLDFMGTVVVGEREWIVVGKPEQSRILADRRRRYDAEHVVVGFRRYVFRISR